MYRTVSDWKPVIPLAEGLKYLILLAGALLSHCYFECKLDFHDDMPSVRNYCHEQFSPSGPGNPEIPDFTVHCESLLDEACPVNRVPWRFSYSRVPRSRVSVAVVPFDGFPVEKFRLMLFELASAPARDLLVFDAKAGPRLRLTISISRKLFKLRSLSTIVQIGRSNRYRKQRKLRKMAKPEKTFKVGPVRASVFRNPIQQNGRNLLLPKVVIEVRYKDKSGEWKGTNSLSLNDLPKAVIALQSAYEYLLENKEPPADSDPDLSSDSNEPDYMAPQRAPTGSYGQRSLYPSAS